MSTSGVMEKCQMNPETLKMWQAASSSDAVYRSELLKSQSHEYLLSRISNIPGIVYQPRFPSTNGIDRIKSEPIDGNEREQNRYDGNIRQLERKQPTTKRRQSVQSPMSRSLRPPIVAMGDGNPSNVCQICGKWFRSRQQVTQHLLVHTDERRHKCVYCDRAFKQASHLQQHHRIHTGEKPYRCPLPGCSRAFPQLSNLNHHLRNHDKPEPPLSNTCVYCQRVYASETVLRSHMVKMHTKSASGLAYNPSESPKPNDSESIRKHIFSEAAMNNVGPPRFNANKPFLPHYVHELNYVQMPANMRKYASILTDSKMMLPISIPDQNGNQSHEDILRSRSNEIPNETSRLVESKLPDEEIKRGNAIHDNNQITADLDSSFLVGQFHKTIFKRNNSIFTKKSLYPTGELKKGHVTQGVVGLNNDTEAKLHVDIDTEAKTYESDRESDASSESVDEKGTLEKPTIQYSYTLDGVVEGEIECSDEKNNDSHHDSSLNANDATPSPRLAVDDTNRLYRSGTNRVNTNIELDEYLNQINQIVHSMPNGQHGNEATSVSKGGDQLLLEQMPATGIDNETKSVIFDSGNEWDLTDQISQSKPIHHQPSQDNIQMVPLFSDSSFMKTEICNNNNPNGHSIHSPPDTEVCEASFKFTPSPGNGVTAEENVLGTLIEADCTKSSEGPQRSSRKRKAFRPQRLIHEKTFIADP